MTRKPNCLLLLISVITLVAGAQPPVGGSHTLTRGEVKVLIKNASTPEDHMRLASFYHEESRQLGERRDEHTEDLAEYNKHSSSYPSKYPTVSDHCRGLSGSYGLAAKQAESLAEMHENMARKLR